MTKNPNPTRTMTRSQHARSLAASAKSMGDAVELHHLLAEAAKSRPRNGYLADAVADAARLMAEMEDDYQDRIEQAAADGFTPEAFE